MSSDPLDPMITFSVIVPVFNAGKTIQKCLESIQQQCFTSREVIVVDGGSTDGTVDILKSYAAAFSSFHFISEKDNGIYDAMNKGIGIAKGNWIIFLGGDDELHDDNVLLRVSEKIRQTSARLVYGNAKVVGSTSWAKDGDVYDGPFTVKKLFEQNICHQAIFYHSFIFREMGNFNVRYVVCADWEFNLRCFARTGVEYIDLVISKFHGGGLSTRNTSDDFNLESVIILKDYYRISYFNSLFRTYYWVFFYQAEKSFGQKNWAKALGFLALSFMHADHKLSVLRVLAGRTTRWLKRSKQAR